MTTIADQQFVIVIGWPTTTSDDWLQVAPVLVPHSGYVKVVEGPEAALGEVLPVQGHKSAADADVGVVGKGLANRLELSEGTKIRVRPCWPPFGRVTVALAVAGLVFGALSIVLEVWGDNVPDGIQIVLAAAALLAAVCVAVLPLFAPRPR